MPLTTAQSIAPAGPLGFRRPVRFFIGTDSDISGNDSTIILTNQPQATLVYTKKIINPDLFDAQFREALVSALAAKLVPALQLNISLMKIKAGEAEAMINAARVTNGNEGPQVIDNTPDWIRARGVGYGTFECGYDYLNWDNMSWPAEF